MTKEYITEPARKTPVIADMDVAVVGGGTAGMTAALASARAGARTCLIERSGELGGATVGGLVTTWGNQYVDIEKKPVIGGLSIELLTWLVEHGHTAYRTVDEALGSFPLLYYDHQPLAFHYSQLTREADIHVMLHTGFADPVMDGNRVTGVIVQTKSGRAVVRARQVIDCTGEADVAFAAGTPCRTSQTGTMGLMFILAGVNFDAYFDWLETAPIETDPDIVEWIKTYSGVDLNVISWSRWRFMARNDLFRTPSFLGGAFMSLEHGEIPSPSVQRKAYEEGGEIFPILFPPSQLRRQLREAADTGDFPLMRRFGKKKGYVMFDFGNTAASFGMRRGNLMAFNMCRIMDADAMEGNTLSEAEQTAKEYAYQEAEYLRGHVPGFENSVLVQKSDSVMPRLGRRIEAEYVMTGEDLDEGRTFPDVISRVGGFGVPNTTDIPFRMIQPPGVDNLLVAGKSAAIANSAMRHVPITQSVGQAAGIAAAMCAQQGVSPRQLDMTALQDKLKEAGMILD